MLVGFGCPRRVVDYLETANVSLGSLKQYFEKYRYGMTLQVFFWLPPFPSHFPFKYARGYFCATEEGESH